MEEKKETGRVEAFSDGVFAIAITLLVLDLKPAVDRWLEVHERDTLFEAMWGQWPVFLAFLISFALIGIMWLNHHRLFNLIRRIDHTLLILNLLVLLAATIVPFPTALLGAYSNSNEFERFRDAALIYNGTFLLVAIGYNALWRYAIHSHRLLDQHVDMQAVKRLERQYLFGPLLYVVAFAIAWFSPEVSLGLNALLAIFYLLPGVELHKRDIHQAHKPTSVQTSHQDHNS